MKRVRPQIIGAEEIVGMGRVTRPAMAGAFSVRRQIGASAGLACVMILTLSCSPDLHEVTGPLVPIPNVEGNVVRNGVPLVNHRVRLVDTATDSTVYKTHTNLSGHYGFPGVGIGGWTVKVASGAPDDTTRFSGATCDFVFSTQDSSIVLPTIDLGARGASLLAPPSGVSVAPPSFFEPLTFEWVPCSGTDFSQVRVYDAADSTIWISGKTNNSTLHWNGIRNKGAGSGQPIGPGDYHWRLRLLTGDPAVPIEYTTALRVITIRSAQ